MKIEIQQRINENLARVKNLVQIYELYLQGTGRGRRTAAQTDVLRSAVVLLHACLEDFLRSLEAWKLPLATADVLDNLPLIVGGAHAKKASLGALSAFRGMTVDSVIMESVEVHLRRATYNNIANLCSTLSGIGIDPTGVKQSFHLLEELMSRRHQIVHRADRDDGGGSGNHSVRSIGRRQVYEWIFAVEQFSADVLAIA